MHCTLRLATTAAAKPPPLSFQQFIQRGKVIAMYRKYMRLTKRIPDKSDRREMRQWIRGDFDRYRLESDAQRVEVLLAQATRQYKEMESGMFSML
ncbi:hypothetical protein FBU59_002978 [Linderina macrospora]|uniref:Uncharacterized protein n=1 Tax=Linderina macrospora TaxID=4868 RepID=A0ACC1J9Z1_9FUNG|nr:hypothetical protein FBU59_002978 [Linderina macrospora]